MGCYFLDTYKWMWSTRVKVGSIPCLAEQWWCQVGIWGSCDQDARSALSLLFLQTLCRLAVEEAAPPFSTQTLERLSTKFVCFCNRCLLAWLWSSSCYGGQGKKKKTTFWNNDLKELAATHKKKKPILIPKQHMEHLT